MSDPRRDFAIPSGWTVDDSKDGTTLIGPEGDLSIVFVELEPGPSAQETALSAWRTIDSAFDSKVRMEVAIPTQGGWEEAHQIVYEVPAKDARVELAIVRKLASRAFVNLVRGSTAAVSRRGAQLMEAFGSWKPAGYKQVSLKDSAAIPWTDEQSGQLRGFILSAMTAMQVPGVSIGIVQGGRIVYSDAFGTRNFGEEAPVTPQTRFMIGSTTKALTTLLMAKLIDQGKLNWSTPVCDLLPGFELGDPEITKRLELRHTVSASTGMPRQDAEFLFRYSGITPEDRLAEMKTMKPTTGFGETFQYSNLLVAAGGYAATRAYSSEGSLADAFEKAFIEVILHPLGMNNTFLRQEDALNGEAALPHAIDFNGDVSRIPLHMERFVDSVAPAGAAWSTALDMARYLLLELGKGRMPDGERVVSEETLLERRKKGIKIAENSFYGLGLMTSEDSGMAVAGHDGATLGFTSNMFFLPERDLGVVLLTNTYVAITFLSAAGQKIFELAFGAEPKAEKTIEAGIKMRQEEIALRKQKVTTDPASTEWINEFTGEYRCAELGSATLTKRGEGFWMQFDEWGSAVGSEIQSGGDRLLRLISPPWRGALRLLVDSEAKRLLLDQGQQKYAFHRRQ